MFFIFILPFVTLSNPLLTLSSNVGGSAQSQDAPIVASIPSGTLDSHSSNGTSRHLLYKTVTSSTSLLQPVNTSPEKYVVSQRTKPLSSSDHEESNFIPNVVNGERHTVGDSSSREVISSLDPDVPISSLGNTHGDTEKDASFHLLLKLDREYTPAEIADYIFSTGDEKGFVQGVAEMIEDGQIMASRDDVILFLEAVQEKLSELRGDQYNHEMEEENIYP